MLRPALVPRRAGRGRVGTGTRRVRDAARDGGIPVQEGGAAHGGAGRGRRQRRELRSAASRGELHGARHRREPHRDRTAGDQGGEGVGGARGGAGVRGRPPPRNPEEPLLRGVPPLLLGRHGREPESGQARRAVQRHPPRLLLGRRAVARSRRGHLHVEGIAHVPAELRAGDDGGDGVGDDGDRGGHEEGGGEVGSAGPAEGPERGEQLPGAGGGSGVVLFGVELEEGRRETDCGCRRCRSLGTGWYPATGRVKPERKPEHSSKWAWKLDVVACKRVPGEPPAGEETKNAKGHDMNVSSLPLWKGCVERKDAQLCAAC
mmetsp:Transcript_43870/g.93300  ORF Transcript_43870/g.93300 Transcript_43870/m.93300 type:complete len:318 (+) Transcript_43870:854-1807(+)